MNGALTLGADISLPDGYKSWYYLKVQETGADKKFLVQDSLTYKNIGDKNAGYTEPKLLVKEAIFDQLTTSQIKKEYWVPLKNSAEVGDKPFFLFPLKPTLTFKAMGQQAG